MIMLARAAVPALRRGSISKPVTSILRNLYSGPGSISFVPGLLNLAIGLLGCGSHAFRREAPFLLGRSVGRQLARDLGRSFYDSDTEIERRTGVEIALIFEKEGEEGFRSREREVIADLAALENAVIATGGGAHCRAWAGRGMRLNTGDAAAAG